MDDIEILIRTLTDGVHFKHKTRVTADEKENDENKNLTEEKTAKDENEQSAKEQYVQGKSICYKLEKKTHRRFKGGKPHVILS